MVISSATISAQNTFSDKFSLAGDGAGWTRRALICMTRSDSTVTLRRYAAAAETVWQQRRKLLESIDLTEL